MENGFNMALEEINNSQLSDVKLKFIIEDDRSTVEGAVEAFNKLIHQDKVPVILGVWTSHVAQSVFPIAQENGVVAFSPRRRRLRLDRNWRFYLPGKSPHRCVDSGGCQGNSGKTRLPKGSKR